MELFEQFVYYFSYPLVRYAFVVGILIALCSSLLGVTLVLKRLSFIGDGLSHVAFGAMAFAVVLNFSNQMLLILPVTVLVAILLLCTGKNTKIKGDAAIAMLSVAALALGYLVLNIFPERVGSGNVAGDVCSTLFGSTALLTLSASDVWLCIGLSLFVIGVFCFFYHKLFSITFDENFAAAIGVKVQAYNILLATVIAIVIVLAMKLVGSLLISALVIFPTMSAMRVLKSFRGVILCSAVISVFCAAVGMVVSVLYSTPVGATIVAVNLVVFAVFALIGSIRYGK